jgi:hypothetical protein
LAIHAPDPRAERLVATGRFNLGEDARKLQRLRGPGVHLGAFGYAVEDKPFRLVEVSRQQRGHPVRLEGGDGALHPNVVRFGSPATDHGGIEVGLEFIDH